MRFTLGRKLLNSLIISNYIFEKRAFERVRAANRPLCVCSPSQRTEKCSDPNRVDYEKTSHKSDSPGLDSRKTTCNSTYNDSISNQKPADEECVLQHRLQRIVIVSFLSTDEEL
ncbi:hypothetical protein F2P81_002641 [Scophthalmus maximus]|uniref:Uncharacterized protein n=1 Tax=Scophthalmus maximus TaxID=52904 RepID=A0A6A4TVP0_SCOMX|nr:hypothetical protein F2P81_002641 [Scophthalmus maximus]